ncbi:MAG: VWA domain-containing protein [Planctomycetota bacterium]
MVLPNAPFREPPPQEAAVERPRPAPYESGLEQSFRHSQFADELFIPPEFAVWKKRCYTSRGASARQARSRISGVRFQAWDRKGGDPTRERQCQSDVMRLVRSVDFLRAKPDLANTVLARRSLRCRASGEVTRAKFGLYVPDGDRYCSSTEAASECRRQIVRAIKKSGFVVEQPRTFEAERGFEGLERWAGALRLRRRRRPSPLWLLLLLLLLLPFVPLSCGAKESFFGIPIDTASFIIVVDRSSSMESSFPAVRAEVKRLLASMQARGGKRFVDVIGYASEAESALAGLRELSSEVADTLANWVDQLQAKGGTRLESGITLAAREVAEHGRETTLIVLSDGEDGSIPDMLQRMPEVEKLFNQVAVVGHTLTPRLFGGSGDPTPLTDPERNLSHFAEALHGHFGPRAAEPHPNEAAAEPHPSEAAAEPHPSEAAAEPHPSEAAAEPHPSEGLFLGPHGSPAASFQPSALGSQPENSSAKREEVSDKDSIREEE